MSQASTTPSNSRETTIATLLRLWPLHIVLICALYVLGGPAWRMARMAVAGSGAEGGVQVDTAGADGRTAGGHYVLDLPVDITNGGQDMVLGVSLWVETYGCPAADTPTNGCRKLTAFEQYVPVRVAPGSATSLVQQMDAVAPAAGEIIRIRRKLQSIDNGEPPLA